MCVEELYRRELAPAPQTSYERFMEQRTNPLGTPVKDMQRLGQKIKAAFAPSPYRFPA